MKKQITQIRDIAEIEKQLIQAQSGVLCIHLANEKLMQIACNFIYLDKNIYTYLDSTDENFEHVKYGSAGTFSVSSSEKINDKSKEFTYRLSFITINGEIRDVDDIKLREQITELYRLKYSRSVEPNGYEVSENLKPIILDTNEIKSLIEEGN
ncbi:MAG: hypothetical protein IT276_07490 [Ignavibacteriaceae bacterium]|nr:hypothetical protein [Ignavibacterium sp.]MCC6254739.1 hypothetical protein [Ignavibacteriaceae bacterium]HMN23902.1 hypothetical protein [Ignavibacteriaceae bacterium]HRN27432.1 hypothetical protein [Ignavibacteriaceae bacterium]HRP94289.1 hypothetical protein [Ignavibacteriaceae bacterium]